MSWIALSYLLSSILLILSIRGLASPRTARRGCLLGFLGMLLAIATTLTLPSVQHRALPILIMLIGSGIGVYSAVKVKMTSLPQMIAAFNGLGGLAAVLIAIAEIIGGSSAYFDNTLGLIIGSLAFSGSLIAFAKLQGLISPLPITFPWLHLVVLILALIVLGLCGSFIISGNQLIFLCLSAIVIILGIILVLPIGGADMPIVISILNSYSGWAAVGIGFSLSNILLIIVGALVGASGAILSYIMVKSMNRSLAAVIFGGFKRNHRQMQTLPLSEKNAQTGSPEDAAFIMENAGKIIIVPGYGMAVAQAQNILKEMAMDLRNLYHVKVLFAIHPVAGRMPGHMNVLLAEANVPYEDVIGLEEGNHELATADVAYIIGANDITNPLAQTDPASPIYGMPVLDVGKAKTVFFVKRSLGHGYSGVENPLFFADNTVMLYGDAKKITEEIVNTLERDK